MKFRVMLVIISLFIIWCDLSYGSFVSGSTCPGGAGCLGDLSPTSNTMITLPPDGILNYGTVSIPAGVTVTFQKNSANTPIYMLASGDVTIDGAINVSGGNGGPTVVGQGGPGGFDGGYNGGLYTDGGKGLGPGGGGQGPYLASGAITGCSGGGGGFGTSGAQGYYINGQGGRQAGSAAGGTYGNVRLVPMVGGSGGGGGSGFTTSAWLSETGGGGGGALLLASSGTIYVNGPITANGGNGGNSGDPYIDGGGGSGGSIRLVANAISGNGLITALGGQTNWRGGAGGKGLIRIEASVNSRTATTDPQYSYGQPTSVFVGNIPSLAITSVGGTSTPANPTGSYSQPDILLPSNTGNPVTVNIAATNIPTGTTVKVRAIPQFGAENLVTATLSGTDQASTASANVTLSTTYSNVVTVEATFTVIAMYFDGEEIDRVHVAATLDGKSETTYITRSGKRIRGDQLLALAR